MNSLITTNKNSKRPKKHDINVPDTKPLKCSLQENLDELKKSVGESSDVIFRYFLGEATERPAVALIYIDGMVNSDQVNQDILQPLDRNSVLKDKELSKEEIFKIIKEQVMHIGGISTCETFEDVYSILFEGFTVILVEGNDTALALATMGWQKRSITEPSSQGVIRGPKEGFTEDLRTGTSLVRRRIKSSDLRIEEFKIGQRTHTRVAIAYMKGIASEEVLKEVRGRLNAINTDSILESSYIEEFIQDGGLTPFPTMQNTERPDAIAGGILEGQVGILIDGTPFALLAPSTFFSFFQSSEDYYQRFDISSFLRLIRYVAFFVSMLLPALYIAITTFHQEMIPTTLIISLAAQREGIPFPAIIEAFMMELTFDVLREAGVRMPRAIGPAISIVGALVLGQAAVQAGLVSAAMVIVVSFTAICNFVIPSIAIANAVRLIRFQMMLAAGILGLFGIMSLMIILLIHMAGLRSFGVPYLSPVAPMKPKYFKDIFIRVPIWLMQIRPKVGANKETRRQAPNNKSLFMQTAAGKEADSQTQSAGNAGTGQQNAGSKNSQQQARGKDNDQQQDDSGDDSQQRNGGNDENQQQDDSGDHAQQRNGGKDNDQQQDADNDHLRPQAPENGDTGLQTSRNGEQTKRRNSNGNQTELTNGSDTQQEIPQEDEAQRQTDDNSQINNNQAEQGSDPA